jgi:glucose/arabinose dehydrogenase
MRSTFQAARARVAVLFLLVLVLPPARAEAQLRAQLVASGLTQPLEFVQDPSDPDVQYIVQQDGRIRALRHGVRSDFLDLSTQISTGGERGLLGLAFPSTYGASGRFYVCFTSPSGDVIVSRFRRSGNPLVADAASRFDLRWSTGERFIRHRTAENHNGGHLAFGADGYLYVGVGDGGGSGDLSNNAQNPSSLLGKLLRIDVAVSDADANGFVVPPGNPFAGTGAPEIWAMGLRNPWKFSFDAATGALFIADVGQNAWEEVNFEPATAKGPMTSISRLLQWFCRCRSRFTSTTIPSGDRLPVDSSIVGRRSVRLTEDAIFSRTSSRPACGR